MTTMIAFAVVAADAAAVGSARLGERAERSITRSTCRTRSTSASPALQPPPVCCAPAGPPVAGEPAPVNMAYFGGHVQVTPKIYLVFWGWGQPGAFDHTTPGHADLRPGRRRRSA